MQCYLPHYGKCVLLQMWDWPTPRLNPDQLPAILELIHGALLLSSFEQLSSSANQIMGSDVINSVVVMPSII